ncbi:MAG: hypothetical protein ABR907_02040 [Terracidiphilus sp.]|jgi:hypothetical protein
MSRQFTTVSRIFLLLAILGFCQPAFSQTRILEVTDGHPVAKAIDLLEGIYGVPITYEDTITVNESQMDDITEKDSRTPDLSRRVMRIKAKTISFAYKLPSSGASRGVNIGQTQTETESNVDDALSSVLDSYAAAGGLVTFSVTKENGVFHVIATNFLNRDGKLQQLTPLLDTKITILQKRRTRIALFREICQSLSEAAGNDVDIMDFPFNGSATQAQTLTTISGSDVPARFLLSQLTEELAAPISLDSTIHIPGGETQRLNRVVYGGGPISWRLFYSPDWGYTLHLRKIMPANQ